MRALGAGLALSGAAACDPLGRTARVPAPRHSPAAPDPLLELLAAERALLAQYDTVIARFPALTRATAVRADHLAHVQALRLLLRAPAGASPAPASVPVSVPASPSAALLALRAGEVAAAARNTAACIAAPSSRAPLLGSIAACESAHLVLLR